MTARILVVDDILPNVKLLEAKLSNEYFDVITAHDGYQALDLVHRDMPDLVLLDVMMPGIDGFEVCRRIKSDAQVAHIPVVMVTALGDVADRVQGLEAGADDFLTKPVDDLALFARVRSLLRLKIMMDELRLRESTSNTLGVMEPSDILSEQPAEGANILLVEDLEYDAERIGAILAQRHAPRIEGDAQAALEMAKSGAFDLVMISLGLQSYDSLRLCSQLRTQMETRQVPILILVDDGDRKRLAKGLDLGVNDYVMRPIDAGELLARTRTQVRRKRYQDRLRDNYHRSMTLAVTDSLTGLYNRHYMTSHLETLMARAHRDGRALTLLMMDIDFFKRINDTLGHAAGDEVLREISARINRSVRGIDLAARFGGEEFVVVLPEMDLPHAGAIAERLRRQVAEAPFKLSTGGTVDVTCSIGIGQSRLGDDPVDLIRRADEALYRAKGEGRDRVVMQKADLPGLGSSDLVTETSGSKVRF